MIHFEMMKMIEKENSELDGKHSTLVKNTPTAWKEKRKEKGNGKRSASDLENSFSVNERRGSDHAPSARPLPRRVTSSAASPPIHSRKYPSNISSSFYFCFQFSFHSVGFLFVAFCARASRTGFPSRHWSVPVDRWQRSSRIRC